MVTAINLGSIYSTGGKTVAGGTASGIDTEKMVNALVDAKKIAVTQLTDQVDVNTKKLTAYSGLKDILSRLQSSVKQLSNPSGFSDTSNAFAYAKGTINSNSSVAGSTYLSMTTTPGADLGSYKITVDAIAKAKTLTTTAGFANKTTSAVEAAGGTTAGMFSAGVLKLNALGTDINVTLNDGDTLLDIQSKINNVRATSGVQANIVKVSDTDYRLQLQSTKTGLAYAFNMSDDGTGVFADVAQTTTQAAADSRVTFNDVTITRSANSIDDIVDGVTFNLLAATPSGTELNATIAPDVDTAVTGIQSFVDTYNELRLFVAQQDERDDQGLPKDTAVLSGDNTLANIANQMAAQIGRVVQNIAATDPRSLSDIGITLTDFPGDTDNIPVPNILQLDSTKLTAALQSNYDSVRKIFEFDMTSDSPDLVVFSRTNSLSVYNFTLDVDTVAGTASANYVVNGANVTVPLDFAAITGGGTITGQAGSPFEGLKLLYTGNGTESINVNITQGVADTLSTNLADMLNENSGLLTGQIKGLNDENTLINTDVTEKNDAIEEYRQQLLDKFSKLEEAISKANSILAALEAQSQARQNN